MRKELRKAAFAVLTFAILMIAGTLSLHGDNRVVSLAGDKCAELVAQQAATVAVVPGAWDCIAGEFKAEMVDAGVTDAASFASIGPGTDPASSVRYIGRTNAGAYIYEVGTAIWKFTVVDGKVVSYR